MAELTEQYKLSVLESTRKGHGKRPAGNSQRLQLEQLSPEAGAELLFCCGGFYPVCTLNVCLVLFCDK
jgi:hypothetical protein